VVVERVRYLQDRSDGRVSTRIREQATDDLGLHRQPARELGLAHATAGSDTLECADEGVGRGDLGTSDLDATVIRNNPAAGLDAAG
jgi:hypothetical protein